MFQLNCYITSNPPVISGGEDDDTTILSSYNQNVTVNTEYSQNIELTASIFVEGQAATGSCVLSIYGSLVPYFTATQSIDVSGVYKCTTNADEFEAVASALANTSAAYAAALFIAVLFIYSLTIRLAS